MKVAWENKKQEMLNVFEREAKYRRIISGRVKRAMEMRNIQKSFLIAAVACHMNFDF
jgi:hypothetical protein